MILSTPFKIFSQKYSLYFFLALYLIVAISVYPYYKYYIDPDGTSYIGIAKKYHDGNFRDAINGFWTSPMISWLIALLLFLPVNAITAAKIAGVIIGFADLIGIFFLVKRFELPVWMNNLFLLASVILIICWIQTGVAVDLLLLPFLCFYFSIIFKKDFFDNPKNSIWCGILGALAYFAKSYAFVFFIPHFLLFNVFHFFKDKNPNRLKTFRRSLLTAYIVFFLACGWWIGFISYKYGKLTYSIAGEINFSMLLNNGVRNIAPNIGYFLEPPNSTAIDYTEDLFYIQGKQVTPFSAPAAFLKLILDTLIVAKDIFLNMSPLSFAVIIISILFAFFQIKKARSSVFVFSTVSVLAFPLGYLLIHIEERYIWIITLLLMIQGLYLLNIFFNTIRIHVIFCILVSSVFLFTFLQNPVKQFLNSANYYDYLYNVAETCKNEYHIKETVYQRGDFGSMQYVCFLINSPQVIKNPSYGVEKPFSWFTPPPKEILLENDIKYFFDWHWGNTPADSIYDFEEITKGKIYGLKIYKIK